MPMVTSGEKRFNIFEQLQRDKTLLTLHIPRVDFDKLTIIIGTMTRDNIPFFLIDKPPGFDEAASDVKGIEIHFEFTGRDKVKYSFKTIGCEISGDKVHIRFPEIIERRQRRKHFRLEPPVNTKLHVAVNSSRYEASVISVSLGGALIVFGEKNEKKPTLKIGQKLNHIQLVFPSDKEDLRVHINRALVKRLGNAPVTGHFHCSVQFTDIEKNEEKMLNEFIYRFQRLFLRKRLPMED